MAKYLQKPCVDIRIITLQVSRKQDQDTLQWRTYAVLLGEAIDEDGTALQPIHRKFNVGPEGPDDWDATGFAADMSAVAGTVAAKYTQVLAEYTTP